MPKKHDELLVNTVQKMRKEHNMTQQDLADAVSVSRQTVVAIERGNYVPSVLLAMKIAKQFNTSIEQLFSYS